MKKIINSWGVKDTLWKFDLKMKITVFLVMVTLFQLKANDSYSQSAKLTLDMYGVSTKDAIREIESVSEFKFLYNHSDIDLNKKISIKVKKKSIKTILSSIFSGTTIEFEVYNKQIILKTSNTTSISQLSSKPVQTSITGTVTDNNGSPLPGANIIEKGTTNGTQTDFDGNFSISVESENSVLEVSYIGFATKEITVGNQTTFTITLEESAAGLDEVVVTALGFKESADKLGSTSSKIGSEGITGTGETGVLNAMGGKAAGVFISKSSGSDPGGGSFIQIRGASTLTGSSQPLFVVDGVPISNSTVGGTTTGGVVQQSRVNDINPNDIETVQILKGASAAALWGSRAANGVVMITTKSGKFNEKMNISFKTSYSIDEVSRLHPKQNIYGQGAGGDFSPTAPRAWGDKISDRAGGADDFDRSGGFFQGYATGNRYYPIINKNSRETFEDKHIDQIFRKGYITEQSLSVSGGNSDTQYFFSVGDLFQKGVFQNSSDYRRSSIRVNAESRLNDVFKISINSTYSKVKSDRVQRSNNAAGALLGYYRMPTDFDITDFKGDYFENSNASPIINRQRAYRNYLGASTNPIYNNPLWTINEQLNPTDVDRLIMGAELSITPIKQLEIVSRLGIDNYTDRRETYFPLYSARNLNGTFRDELIKENQLNFDILGKTQFSWGDNFSGSLILGFNLNDRKFLQLGGEIANFLIPDGPRDFSNAVIEEQTPFDSETNIRTSRGYSVLGLSFFESVFLNMSFAAESSSTFGELSDSTFYYPSADIVWQFSDLNIFKESSFLSFGKLRASYGVVGVQPLPYRTSTLFVPGNGLFGNGAFLQSPNLGSNDLRPERKTEYETGIDLRLFKNRLKTSFTYYANNIDDLLFSVAVPGSTGFTTSYRNAGSMENKGIEIDFSYDLIKTEDFLFSLNFNFNRNRNLVTDLSGTEAVRVGGIGGFLTSDAVEGFPVGVLRGSRYERNTDGSIALDANGFPVSNPENGVIGDPNPDWRGGFGAGLSYKGLSLNVLFETFQGGDFYEGTKSVMYNFGTHSDVGNEVTLTSDLVNYSGATIAAGSTVRGNIQDFGAGDVLLDESFYTTIGGGFGPLKEQFVSDGSWTRLRELSLGYVLDSGKLIDVLGFKSIKFQLTGRNLFLWTALEGIDPDSNNTQVSLGRGVDYFDNPATRSYMFSAELNF